jgi:hypothetical protein
MMRTGRWPRCSWRASARSLDGEEASRSSDRGAHAPDPSQPSASSDSVSLGSPHGTPLRREALVDALDGEHDTICGIGPIAFPIRRCHTSIGYLV